MIILRIRKILMSFSELVGRQKDFSFVCLFSGNTRGSIVGDQAYVAHDRLVSFSIKLFQSEV